MLATLPTYDQRSQKMAEHVAGAIASLKRDVPETSEDFVPTTEALSNKPVGSWMEVARTADQHTRPSH